MQPADARSGIPQHLPTGLQCAGRAIRAHEFERELAGPTVAHCRLHGGLQAAPAGRRVETFMLLERRCRLAGVAPEQNLQLIGPGDRIACRMPFPAAAAADAADALRFAHGRLGPLERRDVRDVGNEALDPAIDGVWKAVGQAVPCLSARAGQQALEGLDMPERGQTDEELVEREQRRAEQVLKGPPDQRSGVDAEPRLVGLVGEPAAQVAVPMAHQRRHLVQDAATLLPLVVGRGIAVPGLGVGNL